MPSTAVVIPAHNAEHYIEKALKSLQDQTVQPDEVVVADDGSTDGTADLVERWGVRVLRLPKGNGNIARNAGARATSADVLFFLDADDWFMPGKVESHLAAHAERDWSMVIDPGLRVTCDGVELGLSGPALDGPIDCEAFTSRTHWYGGSTASLRRAMFEAVDGFREELLSQQDLDFWLRVTHHGGPARVLGRSHTYYLSNPHSLSRNPARVLENLDRMMPKLQFLSPAARRRFRCHILLNTADNLPLPDSLPFLAQALARPWDPRLAKSCLRTVRQTFLVRRREP
jgi:glycosyltransferase involved in cell wall biosynthesis